MDAGTCYEIESGDGSGRLVDFLLVVLMVLHRTMHIIQGVRHEP